MHVSKRSLGEGYIVATGVVLALVLASQTVAAGVAGLFWLVTSGGSVVVLIGAIYWLGRLDLDSEQVWLVANCSALGLGLGTTTLVAIEVVTPTSMIADAGTAVLGATLAATAVTGALCGVVLVLHQSNRRLQGQNAVFHRILRHNLRNDMTVVLCLLDDIEAAGDEETAATARQASEKVRSVVRLTDSVRRADIGPADTGTQRELRDVTAIVESRVEDLDTEHPELTVDLDLPAEALVAVGPRFGLVVDNIVESALSDRTASPQLTIRVEQARETVRVLVEDERKAIPEVDLSAVAIGSETALEHGLGIELWLVEWLVDASDGEVRFESEDDFHRVVVELDRARSAWLR